VGAATRRQARRAACIAGAGRRTCSSFFITTLTVSVSLPHRHTQRRVSAAPGRPRLVPAQAARGGAVARVARSAGGGACQLSVRSSASTAGSSRSPSASDMALASMHGWYSSGQLRSLPKHSVFPRSKQSVPRSKAWIIFYATRTVSLFPPPRLPNKAAASRTVSASLLVA